MSEFHKADIHDFRRMELEAKALVLQGTDDGDYLLKLSETINHYRVELQKVKQERDEAMQIAFDLVDLIYIPEHDWESKTDEKFVELKDRLNKIGDDNDS